MGLRFITKFVNGFWFAFDRHTFRNVGQPYGLKRGAVAETDRRNGFKPGVVRR